MKSTLIRWSRWDTARLFAAVRGARRRVVDGRRRRTVIAGALSAALLCVVGTGAASATAADREVDESRLVPALAPGWGEWSCNLRATGPVCSGERHQRAGEAEATDLPCDVPLYSRFTSDRHQTRFYDRSYRNYFRTFRTTDLDEMSTSPEGPVTATIRAQVRFVETFDVPGDDSTRTITSIGTLWEVRRVDGTPLLRVVGTSVEPYDGAATFSGWITTDSGTEHHRNVPLEVPSELFLVAACDATAH